MYCSIDHNFENVYLGSSDIRLIQRNRRCSIWLQFHWSTKSGIPNYNHKDYDKQSSRCKYRCS